MRVAAYGELALLVEFEESGEDTTARVLALAETIRTAALDGVIDVVPGARSLLVRCTSAEHVISARAALAQLPPTSPQQVDDDLPAATIPVIYDGADLEAVAQSSGLAVNAVIELHSSTVYRAAFVGFRPGFAYLTGLDRRLWLPRRSNPRETVPAGSVAIADRYSGVYPAASPGGWHLLGRTTTTMWKLNRTPPALLVPGSLVRFVAQ